MRTGVTTTLKMSGPILVSVLIFAAVYLPGSHTLSTKGDIKVQVKVPTEAEIGKTVDLKCEWSLSGANKLYSVKWYKDEHEFFRFVPKNDPQIQAFPQPGVFLDKQANTQNSIRLTKLTLETSGQYKCEVSTEAPSFDTDFRSANLTVIDLPERPPDITGLSSPYAVGENVTANCTTWPSLPRAIVSWTINGEPIPPENIIVRHYSSPTSVDRIGSILSLRLEAEARYFEGDGGSATLRCTAYVGAKEYVVESRIEVGHVDNQRLSSNDILRGGGGTDLHGPLNLVIVITGLAMAILHQATLLAT